ncbi:MAG: MarR family transcriptional regulator [Acidimicrobiales bacterium]
MSQEALSQDISERDAIDEIVAQWERERPDLDPGGKHITGRVVRLATLFQETFGREFAPLGLTDGEYGILAPLRRTGAPYALSPTELARHRMITSGGMTAALDRLERKGLISRQPNPDDRRSNLVALTDEGLATVDAAMRVHAEAELRLAAALDPAERATLAGLLRRLVVATEST